jgi:hypothetical protein
MAIAAGGTAAIYKAFEKGPIASTQSHRELVYAVSPRSRITIGEPVTLRTSLPPGSAVQAGAILRACGLEGTIKTYEVPASGVLRFDAPGSMGQCIVTGPPIEGWLVAFTPPRGERPAPRVYSERTLTELHDSGVISHLTIVPVRFVPKARVVLPHVPPPNQTSSCFDDGGVTVAGSRRTPLTGDVDGDGVPDRVYAEGTPVGPSTCHYFVVVKTAHGTLRSRVMSPGIPGMGEQDLAFFFGPLALFRLEGLPGRAILVRLWSGASTESGAVWVVRRGRLVRPSIEGSGPKEFSWFGSVGDGGWLDCVAGKTHTLVEGSYENIRNGSRYKVWTTRYRLVGTTFVLGATRRLVVRHIERYEGVNRLLPHCRGLVTGP